MFLNTPANRAGMNGAAIETAHFPEGLNIVPPEELDSVSSTAYDYIIVGGGAGGCPLAAALAEDKSLRILLLERGASREKYPETKDQPGWFHLPETDALQLSRCTAGAWFARGNCLGGGTAVNIGIFGHASPENIKEEGWDPAEIRSAYEHLGARLSHPGVVGPVQKAVQEAWEDVGLGPNNGVTPEHVHGFKTIMRTWDEQGKRHPADELLVGLDNVDIVTRALVSKVRCTHDGNSALKAVRVDFTAADGTSRHADVTPGRGEVILCAGTVGTPQLLILSGIGPAGGLEKLGIDPLVDLPVGLNLADNPLNAIGVQLKERNEADIISTAAITEKLIYFASVGEKGGTHLSPWGMGSMVPPSDRTPETINAIWAANLALSEEMQEELNRSLVLSFKLYKMKSRGSVTVNSTDPAAEPAVDFAYFSHPDDVTDAIEGVRTLKTVLDSRTITAIKCEKVAGTILQLAPTLADLHPGVYQGALPLLPDVKDESAVATWVKDNVHTCWHMHGTCRVGEVVDKEHRVMGVGGLRIMDMSVFRNSPGTNPMATIMAVGRALGLRMRKNRGQ